MTSSLVTVIVPTYNVISRQEFIAPCIQSLLKQTLISQIKILVVDDGSSDQTVQFLEKEIQPLSSQIQLKVLSQNQGKHHLLNHAVQHWVDTEYFAILDCDDMLMPTAIEAMLNLMQSNPVLSTVKTGVVVISDNQPTCYDFPPQNPDLFRYLMHFNAMVGNSGALWRTRTFLKTIQSYAPDSRTFQISKMACEDCLRLYLLPAEQQNFDAVDAPLMLYRLHSMQWTSSVDKNKQCYDFIYETYRKQLPAEKLMIPEEILFKSTDRRGINKFVYSFNLYSLITFWVRRDRIHFRKVLKNILRRPSGMPWLFYLAVAHLQIFIFPRSQGLMPHQIYQKLEWWYPRLLSPRTKLSASAAQEIKKLINEVSNA